MIYGMKQHIGIKKNVCAFMLALALTSCGDFLKEYSQDLTRVQNFDDLEELVVGEAFLGVGYCQSGVMLSVYNTNYLPLHFMTDELEENLTPATDPERVGSILKYRATMFPYFTWQQDVFLDYKKSDTMESQEEGYWNTAYSKISKCNMILAEAKNLKATTDDDKKLSENINGEVHFLRALYYLTLVNLYADPYAPSTAAVTPGVPVKVTEYLEDKEFQRNSVAEVYGQIVSDLSVAEQSLKDVHEPTSINRVGINAVYLLHSRVALYMQDWETAKKYAELSLQENSSLMTMTTMAEGEIPMQQNNPENIFAMGGTTLGFITFLHPGGVYYGKNYSPVFKISEHLYSLFGENDARKTHFFSTQYGDGNEPYLTKMDYTDAALNVQSHLSDQFMLRSAEAYLNAAEACAQMGDEKQAVNYVKTLRASRITNDGDILYTGNELIKFIRQERERELCCEGLRFFDMRRYTVDVKCPEVETVRHSFTTYEYKNRGYYPQNTTFYEMKTNDGGLTLNIPKTVRDFQQSIGSNSRPLREAVESKTYE